MDVIEFIQHTNLRNLKFNINNMVQKRLQQIHEQLEDRRQMLRNILEAEHLSYSEELALLMRQRIEKAARTRHEWFGVHRKERELEYEKFLELKNLQREMESCEEIRLSHSKALLLDTKQAQLYQIEEKKMMRQKEKEIEQMWVELARRYNEEMLKQDILEQKLLNAIARNTQEKNLGNDDCRKQIIKANSKAMQDDFSENDAYATFLDKLYIAREKSVDKNKKLHQQKELMDQIKKNEENRKINKEWEFNNELESRKQNLCDILSDHCMEVKQKIHHSVWQDHYLNHIKQEKQRKQQESKEFDEMFVNTGCVLQQQNKNPYNKAAR